MEKLLIRPKKWYEEAAIETVSDEVTSVDFGGKTVSTKSGKKIPYTRLVLAPGGQPRSLPLPGFNELGNIFLLRFVTDVQAILGAIGNQRRKIAVIGSSFIGMEVGNALAGKNNDVTIIGQEAAPMAKIMGEQVGRVFQKNLEKNGVKFHLNAGVDKAVPSENDPGKVGAVHLKDGTVVPCDLVVLGTGVRPATDFLKNNPSITLENDGSVKVDEYFSVPGVDSVYAIGDIATFPYHGPGSQSFKGIYTRIEHWNVAQNAGRGVARTLTHELSRTLRIKHKSFIPVFWSALGAQLRYCGATPNGYDDVIIQSEDIENTSKFVAFYCKAQTVVAVATMGMDPVMAKCAELMRRKNMLSKKDIQDGKDVLAVEVPDNVPL